MQQLIPCPRPMKQDAPSSRGFTLIEIAIVIVIFGALLGAFFPLYSLYKKNLAFQQTHENIEAINNAIGVFRSANGRYPCPAAFTLLRNNPEYGRETPIECAVPNPAAPGKIGLNSCDAATGICVYAGFRQVTSSTGTPFTPRIVVGAIPFRQLNLDEKYQYDGYGRKFTYALTEELGNTDTFVTNNGGIEFIDTQGRSLLNNAPNVPGSAHFIVLSHGENGNGAYSREGVQLPCNASSAFERQNCPDSNGTSTFRIAQTSINKTNNREYDDIVSAHLLESVTYFNYSDVPNFATAVSMRMKGSANIGADPEQNTENYPLYIPGGVVRSRENLMTPTICEPDDRTCFSADKIGGEHEDMECNESKGGRYMVKIANGTVVCTNEIEVHCNGDQIVIGIRPNGELICGNKPDIAYVCPARSVEICPNQPAQQLPGSTIIGEEIQLSSGVSRRQTYRCQANGRWRHLDYLDRGVCECDASEVSVYQDQSLCGACTTPESYKLVRATKVCPQGTVRIEVLENHCACTPMQDSQGRWIARNCATPTTLPCPEGYTGRGVTTHSKRECTRAGVPGDWFQDVTEDCRCIPNTAVYRQDPCATGTGTVRQRRTLDCSNGQWSPWEDVENRASICAQSTCTRSTRDGERACPNGYTGRIVTVEERSPATNCQWRYTQDKAGGNQCVPGEGVDMKWVPGGTMTQSAYSVGHRANVSTNCTPGATGQCWLSGYKNYSNCRCE